MLTAASTSGCSSNLATGKKQLNFYTEAEEIAIGQEADAQIVRQLGLVDDPELQAYVAGVGQKLAAESERPGLPWSFKVVDDPVVNAFALPGGFIYVTRGILGHMSSEAELASVLGHEIGHVTAQHGVNQMSKQQVAMGGLLLGAILSPEVAQVGSLAQAGLGLIFLKYGRDDERQADDLGLRYLTKNGFEAREMPRMFTLLDRVSSVSGAGRIPNWLASHPDPGDRRIRSEQLIAERRYPPGEVGVERLLRQVDGLRFGADPREGFFEGSVFYHPAMAFRIDVPAGWQAVNEKHRVIAVHPDGVAQVELRLAAAKSLDEASRTFLAQEGLTTISSRKAKLNGLSTVQADFSVATQRAISGRATFVEKGGQVLQLTGLVYSDRAAVVQGAFDTFLKSFATLKDAKKLGVKPQTIKLVQLAQPMTFDEFARRHPSDLAPELLALVNRIDDRTQTLPAGTLLKQIEGKKAGEQAIGLKTP